MNTSPKHSIIAVAALALALTGCVGGTSGANNPLAPTNVAYFRVVNGSADAGTVDFYIDGNNKTTEAYGGVSNYIKVNTGSHTIAVDVTGTQTAVGGIPTASLTQSINGNTYVDLVLVGETHAVVATDTPNILAFINTPYSTPSGGFALNYHNAAGITAGTGTNFGITSASGSQQLGATINVGGATQPVGVPSTFIAPTMTVTFTATTGSTTASIAPSNVDSAGCAANTLPCNSGNLSLYYIDGPAASLVPSAAPYPPGVSASQTATFVGIFDAQGT